MNREKRTEMKMNKYCSFCKLYLIYETAIYLKFYHFSVISSPGKCTRRSRTTTQSIYRYIHIAIAVRIKCIKLKKISYRVYFIIVDNVRNYTAA